jgi:ATP-binding cassette subfamily C protein LapB
VLRGDSREFLQDIRTNHQALKPEISAGSPARKPDLRRTELGLGQSVGLTGRHGSVKSTFFDLIYGSRQPTRGWIEIDGFDLRELDRAQLRSQVALLREGEIFDGSIADNLRLGRALDSGEVRAALAQVGLLEHCLRLPQGLDTRVTSGSSLLSSGQHLDIR